MPLYRQEKDFQRLGISLPRQTMANWMIKIVSTYLAPIYEAMKKQLLKSDVLHADETTLQVLKEPNKAPTSKSYMWLYRTGKLEKNQVVLYEYQPNRRHMIAQNFLKDFKGFLHTDGYEAYHDLNEGITVCGCFAHVRRKFNDALNSIPVTVRSDSLAIIGRNYCTQLFNIEKT